MGDPRVINAPFGFIVEISVKGDGYMCIKIWNDNVESVLDSDQDWSLA